MASTSRRGNRFSRHWTKERVQEAVNAWHRKFGRPPTEADWNPARAKFLMAGSEKRVKRWKEAIDEYATGKYPSSRTLQDLYDGQWAAGIRDAGFVPLPAGRPSRENRQAWIGQASEDTVSETALRFQWEVVASAINSDDKYELRRALLDLASIAATLAEEI